MMNLIFKNCRRPPVVQKPLEIDDNFLFASNYKTFIFQAKNAIIITTKERKSAFT